MKKHIFLNLFFFTVLALYTYSVFPVSAYSETKEVKTSYKRYSIFRYDHEDILCEPYIVNKDDWLYKIFRKKGEISEKDFPHFIIIFKKINPEISNIDAIKPADHILIPLKRVKPEDYHQSISGDIDIPIIEFSTLPEKLKTKKNNLNKKKPALKQSKIDAYKLAQLKKYSSLIDGTLLNRGKMYFPGKNNSTQVLDLSSTPIIETRDGSKILIISDDDTNDDLLKYVKSYWKNLKTQLALDAIDKMKNSKDLNSPKNITMTHKKIIKTLLAQTEYDYIPDAKIPFMLNHIHLEASFGRVIRRDMTDLLLNFGAVYGAALEVLKKQEFEIISITPQLTVLALTQTLFTHLGYTTWANPSFPDNGTIKHIDGLYAVKKQDKLFIPVKPLNTNAIDYLKKEEIKILSTEIPSPPQ